MSKVSNNLGSKIQRYYNDLKNNVIQPRTEEMILLAKMKELESLEPMSMDKNEMKEFGGKNLQTASS